MKICAIICEYNPFHNGHRYQLQRAREISGADAIVCFMSGSFVQRGEAAIMDKYTRAKHALLSGADAVIELPAVFATSNAELFAKGGVHLLSSIPDVKCLCFGAENADAAAYHRAAKYLNDEPEDVSKAIKALTGTGMSYAQARAQAFSEYIPIDMLTSPNAILGLEYTRALVRKDIEILPVRRLGGGYNDETFKEDFSSATAIRARIQQGKEIVDNLPDCVREDLPKSLENALDGLEKYAILATDKDTIAKVCDCTEGLENAFKKAANSEKPLSQSLVSARYTASRIRRIALQNLLKIEEDFIRQCLQNPLYLRLLAVRKDNVRLLSALAESPFPLLVRAHDENALSGVAKRAFETDNFADNVRDLLYPTPKKEKNIFT